MAELGCGSMLCGSLCDVSYKIQTDSSSSSDIPEIFYCCSLSERREITRYTVRISSEKTEMDGEIQNNCYCPKFCETHL